MSKKEKKAPEYVLTLEDERIITEMCPDGDRANVQAAYKYVNKVSDNRLSKERVEDLVEDIIWINSLPEVDLSAHTIKELSELVAQARHTLSEDEISAISGHASQALFILSDKFSRMYLLIKEEAPFRRFVSACTALCEIDKYVLLMSLKEAFDIPLSCKKMERKISVALEKQLRRFPPAGGRPETMICEARRMIIGGIYSEFQNSYGIQPTDTQGGLFECFIKILFNDPALRKQGFPINDVRPLIRETQQGDSHRKKG